MEELCARSEIDMGYREWLKKMHERSLALAHHDNSENSTAEGDVGTIGYITSKVRSCSFSVCYFVGAGLICLAPSLPFQAVPR